MPGYASICTHILSCKHVESFEYLLLSPSLLLCVGLLLWISPSCSLETLWHKCTAKLLSLSMDVCLLASWNPPLLLAFLLLPQRYVLSRCTYIVTFVICCDDQFYCHELFYFQILCCFTILFIRRMSLTWMHCWIASAVIECWLLGEVGVLDFAELNHSLIKFSPGIYCNCCVCCYHLCGCVYCYVYSCTWMYISRGSGVHCGSY